MTSTAYLRLVVAHVQHADERDGGGGRNVLTVDVAVSQLAQERDQHIAEKAVRLVKEHDERLARAAAEIRKRIRNRRHRPARILVANACRTFRFGRRRERRYGICAAEQKPSELRHGIVRIFRALKRLQRAVERDLFVLRVNLADERLDRRRLARLARRVDDELLPPADEPPDSRKAVERRKHVVLPRNARSRDVEMAFHVAEHTKATCTRQAHIHLWGAAISAVAA